MGNCVVARDCAGDEGHEEEVVESSPFAEARATDDVVNDGADGGNGGSSGDGRGG